MNKIDSKNASKKSSSLVNTFFDNLKSKFKKYSSNYKSLPIGTKRLLSLGMVLSLVIFLPFLILTIVSTTTSFYNRAATGEPTGEPPATPTPFPSSSPGLTPKPTPVGNSVGWITGNVHLSASNFYLNIDGNNLFIDNNSTLSIHSDPGNSVYTTLETTWEENGVEMRLFMYFSRDPSTNRWRVTEIRTYNGSNPGNWLFYPGFEGTDAGSAYYTGNANYYSNDGRGVVHFENLTLQLYFAGISTPTPTPGITPPPTVRPFEILLKLKGVDGDGANLANATVKFVSSALDYTLGYITPSLPMIYEGDGIYRLPFGVWSENLPAANDYSIIIKGEKHLASKFCLATGQTEHCSGSGQISLPVNPISKVSLDFTKMPLEPGDLYQQDGVANGNDFKKIINLLIKPCSTLTDQDKLVGDLDYNGCVNIRDAFLMRQTLETRYDEY